MYNETASISNNNEETIEVTPQTQEREEVQEELDRLDKWEEFVDILIPQKEQELADITEEEKAELFFASKYNPTVEEVETRKRRIEKSKYELVPMDKATEENNVIQRIAKKKEEASRESEPKTKWEEVKQIGKKSLETITYVTGGIPHNSVKNINSLLKTNYPSLENKKLIPDFYKAVARHYKDRPNELNQPIEEIALKAIDRYERIGKNIATDTVFYDSLNEKQKEKELADPSYNQLADSSIVELGTTPDERWNDSLNVLKQIPHLTLNTVPSTDNICNGYGEEQKALLQRFQKHPTFVAKKDSSGNSNYDREIFYNSFIRAITYSDIFHDPERLIDNQSDRAIALYSDNYYVTSQSSSRDREYSLGALNIGFDETNTSKEIKDFVLGKEDESKPSPEVVRQRMELIKKISQSSKLDTNELLKYLSDENNERNIEKITIYSKFFNVANMLSGFTSEISSVSSIDRVLKNIDYTYFQEIDQSIPPQENLENITKARISHLLNSPMRPDSETDYYKTHIEELYEIKNNDVSFSPKLLELVHKDDYLLNHQYNKDFVEKVINNLENEDAKNFWKIFYEYSNISSTGLREYIVNSSYDYPAFLEKYLSTENGKLYANENFYNRFVLEKMRNRKSYEREYRTQISKDLQHFKDDKSIFFWSAISNLHHYQHEADIITLFKSAKDINTETLHQFIDKYTTILPTESGDQRFYNDAFWEDISIIDTGFLINNPSFLSNEVMDSLPEEKRFFWDTLKHTHKNPVYILEFLDIKGDGGRLPITEFINKYTTVIHTESGDQRFYNDAFWEDTTLKSPNFPIHNPSFISKEMIDSLPEEKKMFWASFTNIKNFQDQWDYLKFLEMEGDKEESPVVEFINKYTTVLSTESGEQRFYNETFWTDITLKNPNFLIHNPSFVNKEIINSLPEETGRFWASYIQVTDDTARQLFFKLYTSQKLDTVEKVDACNEAIFQILNSPSREIGRLQENILLAVFSGDKDIPQIQHEIYNIKNTFEKNNSPTAVLRLKVFQQLYLDSVFENKSAMSGLFSNILENKEYDKNTKKAVISEIIRKDLLNIAKDSVDENLYNFLGELRDGYGALTFYDNLLQEGFTDEEIINQLGAEEKEFLSRSLDLFFTASYSTSVNNESISSRIAELREVLEIHNDKTFADGIYKSYITPILGNKATGDMHEDIESIMNDMLQRKEEAHQRGLEYARTGITIAPGDLLKVVKSLEGMIDDGIYAKDFLGAEADQDYTPFDADAIMVDEGEGFTSDNPVATIREKKAYNDTGITLVLRNRGQYYKDGEQVRDYELIKAKGSAFGAYHYGIRTGVATTEIDYILFQTGDFNKLKFDIASKDVYIPVFNENGKLIFTPEEYEKQRETFAGVKGLKGKPFRVDTKTEVIENALQQIQREHQMHNEKTVRIGEYIEDTIKQSIERLGLDEEVLFETSRSGLNGIRVEHTGSTARLTNVLGASDYDFSILIPSNILNRLNASQKKGLIGDITKSIGGVTHDGMVHDTNETTQLVGSRIKVDPTKVGIAQEEVIEFDVSIADKSRNLDGSNSHEFIIERLESIKETEGEEKYNFVVSNILFAKEFLKKFECYKKGDHGQGGMGGIGVENWILQHNGNFEKAVDAFLATSKGIDGRTLSFDEFKRKYTVYDPGVDIRTQSHDNFVANNMNANGYTKMIDAFTNFKENGITLEELRRR